MLPLVRSVACSGSILIGLQALFETLLFIKFTQKDRWEIMWAFMVNKLAHKTRYSFMQLSLFIYVGYITLIQKAIENEMSKFITTLVFTNGKFTLVSLRV